MTNLHIQDKNWRQTPTGETRGYIQPQWLHELWFHTGTICNLSCPFCLEGSNPGDDRLNKMTIEDVQPFIDEALTLGVKKFSFTGGEPFVVKDTIKILDYALEHRPCLVLTNATNPLLRRMDEIALLKGKPHALSFRVSFDYALREQHDAGRGQGNFDLAWQGVRELTARGFNVSIARQRLKEEKAGQVDRDFARLLKANGLAADTRIVSFPDFLTPGSLSEVPHITESCMTQYHNQESRDQFMCNFSKMVVKKDGRMRVYACTLVDDDVDYDLGDNLTTSMKIRVMLKHHRCYSCFAQGASCSEL